MRNIDVQQELIRTGIEFTTRAEGEYRIHCPFHDDANPSCDVSQQLQRFSCHGCQASGSIVDLLCKIVGEPKHLILARLSLDNATDKPVDPSAIERFHRNIWTAPPLLAALRERGVSDDTIRRFRLGETEGRISIPIANAFGVFINVRKYLPGAVGAAKFMNIKGRGAARFYPYSQFQYDELVLCGGEVKALAALQRLNDHGIGALCLTGGEGAWVPAYEELFRGKKVWVCLDTDLAGRKAAEHHCSRLSKIADWIGNVELPLDPVKFPKGDLNDYVMTVPDGLLELLRETPQWVNVKEVERIAEETADPIECSIREAMSADMVHKRFKSQVTMTGVTEDLYFLPKDVKPICNKDQPSCTFCPVYPTEPGTLFTVASESVHLLSMMEQGDVSVREEVRQALHIPPCEAVKFDPKTHYKVSDARGQRAMNLTEQDSDRTSVPIIVVGANFDLNETYEVTGKSVPHPKTQQCVAIVSKAVPIADALTDFKLQEPETLLRFQPKEWTLQSLNEVLDPFYNEMALNVTHIYERPRLHQLVDLAYHSVLGIKVSGKEKKGWVECLIIGDSSQGKTETVTGMMNYYGLGDKMDCKNATVAGVIGGLDTGHGGKWYIQWGVVPTNDRKLVFFEELKGMPQDVFGKFTDMRSSGIAEIPKILRSKSQARTRLIAASNPPKRSMSSYSHGVNAVQDLIKSSEDVRRFDVCMILNKGDIHADVINQHRNEIEPTFTAEQCRKLILWCWTLSYEQVTFEPETLELALKETRDLCNDFTEAIPIIDRGDTRNKILRLAAALAGRTFSCTEDYQCMVVRPCHVAWVVNFLRDEYSRPNHGYAEISKQAKKHEVLIDESMLSTALTTFPNMQTVAERILFADEFNQTDISNWTGWEESEAIIAIRKLVQNNALTREGNIYRKTPAFTLFLTKFVKAPPEIPAHIAKSREDKYG